jgi:hypothetical protein
MPEKSQRDVCPKAKNQKESEKMKYFIVVPTQTRYHDIIV